MKNDDVLLITADVLPERYRDAEIGSLVVVTHVAAIHALKDIREQITNLLGGEMTRYEALLQSSVDQALEKTRRNGARRRLGRRLCGAAVAPQRGRWRL